MSQKITTTPLIYLLSESVSNPFFLLAKPQLGKPKLDIPKLGLGNEEGFDDRLQKDGKLLKASRGRSYKCS
ncbi:MAG: hypothetical protein IPG09_13210 [Ignavibacteria bacterium]|nr:hypothetical protein [Ignavibacteria bacterium]